MTSTEAEKSTGLTAREVVAKEETGPADRNLVAIGNLFRCQLGRNIPHTVTVTETTETGRVIQHEVNTTLFELHAYGSSFEEAHAMLMRRRAGK